MARPTCDLEPARRAATLLVKSVDFPAVRVPADPAFPLTITPGAQPGVL
jgi:hypothetical protein